MQRSQLIMTASAALLAVLALGCTFAPDEILTLLGVTAEPVPSLAVQLVGALYLGFGFLNWSTRTNLIGGIYGRPLVLGNLMHFLVGGLAMLRVVLDGSGAPWLIGLLLFYLAFAAAFGYLMLRGSDAAGQ